MERIITRETLEHRHQQRIDYFTSGNSHYGSPPKKLFNDDSIFNESNWNGGDAIIRQFTGHLEDKDRYVGEFDYLNYGYSLISSWQYYEDMNYVNIVLRKYCHDEETFEKEDWTYDTYLIVYYKRRGVTDEVQLNGKRVTYDEYVNLLNIIEASGYKFDLKP